MEDDRQTIHTPAGSTIEPTGEGGYQICDRDHHCLRVDNLWEAQQLVQWAEVHHIALESSKVRFF